jgi:hypothetical protein
MNRLGFARKVPLERARYSASALFLRTLWPDFAASGARWKGMIFLFLASGHLVEDSDHGLPSHYFRRCNGLEWNVGHCSRR